MNSFEIEGVRSILRDLYDFPDVIAQVMRERLDMVSANKQVGFFSDAYCVEWSYAKAALVRKILARVLADRVEMGQFDVPGALAFARAILFDSPQSLLGTVPRSLDQTELR
jgi:hypothetical protein